MRNGRKKYWITAKLVCVLFLGLAVLAGCKKKTEPVSPSSPNKAAENVSSATEQTTCPVMGGAIDKDIYTEYQGKKVYFCCPGCKPEFEKDPNKYIDKLPQFKK